MAIGLGANLGDPVSAVRRAAHALTAFVTTPRLSPLYRTSPVGGPPQPPFVNAVLAGRTELAPRELLGRLQLLERAAGRRRGPHNGPRPLDLDLLLYADCSRAAPAPVLPHPRLASRLFVLVPLADVAPRRTVPGTGKTVARLLSEVRVRSGDSVRLLRGARRPSGTRTSAATPRG
ncbi:MAG: 2-amino-4-hydroxy-6-hydroxymethyldihydropteridine diphosphokinase [Acidithiobacillales bacterium]